MTTLPAHQQQGVLAPTEAQDDSAKTPFASIPDAFRNAIGAIAAVAPIVADAIVSELLDQERTLKLIASENYSPLQVQLAHANWLTDKYAEGSPGNRFYAGCDNIDTIEEEAIRAACEIFQADHAYVQPHSGADANLVAFMSILHHRVQSPYLESLGQKKLTDLSEPDWVRLREKVGRQRVLAMDFYSGGHLTHGYRMNISAQLLDFHTYHVDPETGLLGLDEVRRRLSEVEPLILLAGYSAYSRKINFAKLRELADEAGAILMVDMAHFAGLVAGKVFTGDFDPVRHAHIVTSTTHKTLRGPRGGLILCAKELKESVDKGCPFVLGGPLPHTMAAKAVAFQMANTSEFQQYASRIVENARALSEGFMSRGVPVISGGTDNHMILVNVFEHFGISGKQAEHELRKRGITLNRNAIPGDTNGPWHTSGLRLGTAALTSRGFTTDDMSTIADMVIRLLQNIEPKLTSSGQPSFSMSYSLVNEDSALSIAEEVAFLASQHPIYPELKFLGR